MSKKPSKAKLQTNAICAAWDSLTATSPEYRQSRHFKEMQEHWDAEDRFPYDESIYFSLYLCDLLYSNQTAPIVTVFEKLEELLKTHRDDDGITDFLVVGFIENFQAKMVHYRQPMKLERAGRLITGPWTKHYWHEVIKYWDGGGLIQKPTHL